MSEFPETQAARFFVLLCAVLFYILAVVVYFHAVPGFTVGVYILASVGTLFLAVFLFGSETACNVVAHLLTLGWIGG